MITSDQKHRLIDSITLLNIPGIGRGRFKKLVARFGSASAVLAASVADLETVTGISHGLASSIRNESDRTGAAAIAEKIHELAWAVLFPDSTDYPKALATLPDAPPILFRLGGNASSGRAIAIVGTRRPTDRGKQFAYNLSEALAQRGIAVVSGMAEGIDGAAHLGALEAGGLTSAVWGTSLDIVYPSIHRELATRIQQSGGIYSEYFPGTEPEKAYFPERNRIISGISDGVVVVEAGIKSGALITATHALEQGRELFAVPGAPDAPLSTGTNALIKKGARLLTTVDDIFEELPRLFGPVKTRPFQAPPDLTETERKLLSHLTDGPVQIDHLSRVSSLAMPELLEYLLALEMKGMVQELSGKRFVLAEPSR